MDTLQTSSGSNSSSSISSRSTNNNNGSRNIDDMNVNNVGRAKVKARRAEIMIEAT